MTNYESRITRAVTFNPAAFVQLKACQRLYQLQADQSEPGRTVTNSETLARIFFDHSRLGLVAASQGMQVHELCAALAFGDLVIAAPAKGALSTSCGSTS